MKLENKGAIDLKVGSYYLVKLEGFNASGFCIARFQYNSVNPYLCEEQTLTDLSEFKITSVTKL